MSRTLRVALAVAVALVVGQWLAIVHEGQHPLAHPESLHCSICLQAHNLGYASVTAKLSLQLPQIAVSFFVSPITTRNVRRPHAVNNRGPPRFLQV